MEEQDTALAADFQVHENRFHQSRPRTPPLQGSPRPPRDRPPERPVRSPHPSNSAPAASVHQHSVLEETVQQLVHMNQNFCTTIEQQQAQFNRLLQENRPPDRSCIPSIPGQDRQTGLQFWLDAIPHFDGKKCEDFFEGISKIEDAARQAANSPNDQHWTEYRIATLKARGSVFTHLKAKSDATPWIKLKEGLQMEFSSLPTMIDAINALEERTQGPHETLDEYTQEFFRLNYTVHGTLPSHTQNKHIFNKYIHGLYEPELLRKCAKQQGSFDNLHDVATYAKLQSQKLRMQDMTVSCALMQDSIMPLQESPKQMAPPRNRNPNGQNLPGSLPTTPVPWVTPFTFYRMAPEDWTEDMICIAAARWIDWKCYACKEFSHAKYVCDAPAVRQRLDVIQLELRPSLVHERSKAKALQGAFHASHTHITQVNPSLVSPERFNQQMNQVAKAMNPKPKPKTPPKSSPRTTPPPNPPRRPSAGPGQKSPKIVTIKDKPTVIPSSGPITRSHAPHAQRDLTAQFNAFLHAVELDEKTPEETDKTFEDQVAALLEAETDDKIQYDSEPAEDDASEGVPEDTGEVAILSPTRGPPAPTDTELEAINHSLFPIRIHRHASFALHDTGATHSVISKALYDTLQDPPELIPTRCSVQVGNGESLTLAGEVTLGFTLGLQRFSARFLVSPHLIHPVILGTDFQRIGAVCLVYKKGKAHLVFLKQPKHTPTLAALVVGEPKAVRRLRLKEKTRFPRNAVAEVWTQTVSQELPSDPYLDVEPTCQFLQECPYLEMIPAVHCPCGLTQVSVVPVTIINRSSRDIVLPMGYHLASLMTPKVEADITHVPFAQCASLPTCPVTAGQETDGQIATFMSTQLLDIHEPEWDLPSTEPDFDSEDLPELEEIPDLPERDKEALIVPAEKSAQYLGAVLNIPVEMKGEAVIPAECVAIGSDKRLPSDPQGTSMMTSPEHAPKCERPPLADCPCTPSQLERFEQLCAEYANIFSTNHLDVGHTRLIEVDIDTGDSPPIAQAPYRVALQHVDWL